MSKTDYDLSKIQAVAFDVDGVLSPACVPMYSNGIPRRMANLRDGYGMVLAIRSGIKIALITGCNDPAVIERFKAIGIDEDDIHFVSGAKLPILKKWMEKYGLLPENVAYVGDDIPDYECLKSVGLPVAPADAVPEIRNAATYVTSAEGGYGVARELLEQILKAQKKWPLVVNATGL